MQYNQPPTTEQQGTLLGYHSMMHQQALPGVHLASHHAGAAHQHLNVFQGFPQVLNVNSGGGGGAVMQLVQTPYGLVQVQSLQPVAQPQQQPLAVAPMHHVPHQILQQQIQPQQQQYQQQQQHYLGGLSHGPHGNPPAAFTSLAGLLPPQASLDAQGGQQQQQQVFQYVLGPGGQISAVPSYAMGGGLQASHAVQAQPQSQPSQAQAQGGYAVMLAQALQQQHQHQQQLLQLQQQAAGLAGLAPPAAKTASPTQGALFATQAPPGAAFSAPLGPPAALLPSGHAGQQLTPQGSLAAFNPLASGSGKDILGPAQGDTVRQSEPASQTVLHVESLGLSAPPGSDRLAAQNASLAAAAGQPPGAQGPPPARSPPTAAWLAQHEAALAAAALAGKAKPATRGAWPQNGNAAGARGKPKARPAAAAAAAAAATAGHGPVSGPSSGGGSGEGASPGAATPPEAAANAKPSNKTKPKAKVDPKPKAEGAPAAAAAADTAAAAADESDEEEAGDAEAGFLKVMDYKNYFKQIRVPAAEGRRIFPPASSPLSIRGPDGRIFQCTYTFFDYGNTRSYRQIKGGWRNVVAAYDIKFGDTIVLSRVAAKRPSDMTLEIQRGTGQPPQAPGGADSQDDPEDEVDVIDAGPAAAAAAPPSPAQRPPDALLLALLDEVEEAEAGEEARPAALEAPAADPVASNEAAAAAAAPHAFTTDSPVCSSKSGSKSEEEEEEEEEEEMGGSMHVLVARSPRAEGSGGIGSAVPAPGAKRPREEPDAAAEAGVAAGLEQAEPHAPPAKRASLEGGARREPSPAAGSPSPA